MDFNRICLRCMNGEMLSNGICSMCGMPPLTEQSLACAIPLKTKIHNRYFIGQVLGQGGFGITYAAYDLEENRRVVIKELFPSFMVNRSPGSLQVKVIKDQEFFQKCRDRFVKEAQLIYTFRSTPEIVDVYHIFIENGTGYYAMEFLSGQTLQSFVKSNGGKLTWVQLMPITRDVINALRVLHLNGSIHRDISPDNIFLSNNGKAKVIDFGAARQYKLESGTTPILKKGYAPWEQYQTNGDLGPWTDIYALSATLYYCLTGQMVPESTSRIVQDTLRRPSAFGGNIPMFVEAAILQGLGIRPDQRFQNVDALAFGLRITNRDGSLPLPSNERWQLRCIRGIHAGKQFPFDSNIVIGRDPNKCTVVYPMDSPGVSRVHITLLFGSGPQFPGFRCDSATQPVFVNGTMYNGQGCIGRLQSGDRISFGDNQIYIVERI